MVKGFKGFLHDHHNKISKQRSDIKRLFKQIAVKFNMKFVTEFEGMYKLTSNQKYNPTYHCFDDIEKITNYINQHPLHGFEFVNDYVSSKWWQSDIYVVSLISSRRHDDKHGSYSVIVLYGKEVEE